MDKVTITICWKLTAKPQRQFVATISKGTSIAELLLQLGEKPQDADMLIVYNGKTAWVTDPINENGELIILPVLCGG